MAKAKPYASKVLRGGDRQRTFEVGEQLQIQMPLGGIGAGNVCLNGHGGLSDFSIRNRPAISADGGVHSHHNAAFATLHIKGKNSITRLVEGPLPVESVYNQGIKSQGVLGGGFEGFPRFRNCTFRGEYPFGNVRLRDAKIPLSVEISGFNPFIPLDDKDSGLPCAILEYTLTNRSKKSVDFEFSYHLSHLAQGSAKAGENSRNTIIPKRGVAFTNTDHADAETFGSASLSVIGHQPKIKGMWFRGGWFDGMSALWKEVSEGRFRANAGSNRRDTKGGNGGSIMLAGTLAPGEKITYPILITWHFPNVHYYSGPATPEWEAEEKCCTTGECCTPNKPKWKPWYSTQWEDATAVADYVHDRYDSLRRRTKDFHDALFSTTLPDYVLDAVSANLAILKSPTVLRLASGHLWAWEGCNPGSGCCHGSCTHVWNYAQALPHLFPNLERSLREQELNDSMNRAGHINFRSALPIRTTDHDYRPAADGQLGGIMKVYRDWQICGDDKWLKNVYPRVKRSMDYAIKTWDPKKRGVLSEPHHNTYDIEFWGADGMCSSFYLGALTAMAEICRAVDNAEAAKPYTALAAKGAAYLDSKLFNGEYYEQKVEYKNLRDQSFAKKMRQVNAKSGEVDKLLKREGPKYQYGLGCLSDGVMGAWKAKIYGLKSPQTPAKIRRNLRAIFQYNFKPSLWEHANPQRPGYALGDEAGVLLCTWPNGNKPTLPFVYSDEVWTGIEYQVASHLIEEGFIDEGLTIVKGVRDRYDGRSRNPWNEYECGNYYARAMASYALLGSLAGFRYSKVEKTLWFAPKINERNFQTFFSTADGYGTIALKGKAVTIKLLAGTLAVDTLIVKQKGKSRRIECGCTIKAGRAKTIAI